MHGDEEKTRKELLAELAEHRLRLTQLELIEQEHDKAVRKLRQSEQRFHEMAELLPQTLFEIDLAGNLTYTNQAGLAMSGYTPEDLKRGLRFIQLYIPEDLERLSQNIKRHMQGEDFDDHEYTLLRSDGRTVPILLFSSPIIRKGKPLGIRSVALDMTAQKASAAEVARVMEELERSNKELEVFAYIVSHDLQEPLRMVSSYVQLLEKRYSDQLDSDAGEFIEFAVDGAKRMQRLINDLLLYSRVRTKGQPPEAVEMERTLQAVCDNLKIAIEECDAQVTHNELPIVAADVTQMIQLLQNLVGNAIKFRGEEPPRVHVSAVRDGAMWRFAVRDNGIGIAGKDRERIFQIFQRLHRRGDYPGTGIGLAVAKQIVERHGGRIHVADEPDAGTTFEFTLPAGDAA